MKNIREILAENIKRFRKEKAWTQTELGDRAGLALPTIQSYEYLNSSPTMENLEKLSRVLGKSVPEFFKEYEKSPEKIAENESISMFRELLTNLTALDDGELQGLLLTLRALANRSKSSSSQPADTKLKASKLSKK